MIDNISQAYIINKKLVKDHMFANKLIAAAIHVTKLSTSMKFTRKRKRKWKKKKNKNKKNRKDSQRCLIAQDVDSLKLLIYEKVRTAHFLETNSFTATNDAEVKNCIVYV